MINIWREKNFPKSEMTFATVAKTLLYLWSVKVPASVYKSRSWKKSILWSLSYYWKQFEKKKRIQVMLNKTFSNIFKCPEFIFQWLRSLKMNGVTTTLARHKASREFMGGYYSQTTSCTNILERCEQLSIHVLTSLQTICGIYFTLICCTLSKWSSTWY